MRRPGGFTTRELVSSHLDPDLCRRIRASILIAGPVAGARGQFAPAAPRAVM